jgi:hypothetical protein
MFPALRPLFTKMFKSWTRMSVKIIFTDDLMFSTTEKRVPFSIHISFGNSQKSAGAKSGDYGWWSVAEMPFLLKNCDTRSEERVCGLAWWRINERSLHNSPRLGLTVSIQHLHVECVINSGHFGYRFKVDDTADVEKADQHYLDFGLWHPWLLARGFAINCS